jgi:hypothetical protein
MSGLSNLEHILAHTLGPWGHMTAPNRLVVARGRARYNMYEDSILRMEVIPILALVSHGGGIGARHADGC